MEGLDLLPELGNIAGIAGIALGICALVFLAIIRSKHNSPGILKRLLNYTFILAILCLIIYIIPNIIPPDTIEPVVDETKGEIKPELIPDEAPPPVTINCDIWDNNIAALNEGLPAQGGQNPVSIQNLLSALNRIQNPSNNNAISNTVQEIKSFLNGAIERGDQSIPFAPPLRQKINRLRTLLREQKEQCLN